MENTLLSEIYEPQIPTKQSKVVFDRNQQADCRDTGSLVGQLATYLSLILMTGGENHNSRAALLWAGAKVTSAAALFSESYLSFKKASVRPNKAPKP